MSMPTRARKNGLWMAVKNCSVSYRGELTQEVLATRVLPPDRTVTRQGRCVRLVYLMAVK
jgi:hypothetical protein